MSFEDRGQERWIRFEGELDYDGCERCQSLFAEVAAEAPDVVVVDLGEVSFIASPGIRMLLKAQKSLKDAGKSLSLTGLRPHVRKIFQTLGLFQAIPEWNE